MAALGVTLALACGTPSSVIDAAAPLDAGSDASVARRDAARLDVGPPSVDASFERLSGDVRHPLDDELRLNQLQALGTHNSYHLRNMPEVIDDWAYDMAPLPDQLANEGVRAIELDVHWDPAIQRLRVYHLDLLDPRSTCDLFLDCLVEVRRFSDAHPGHHPIFVHVEPKSETGISTVDFGNELDAEIRAVFDSDLLITPDLVRSGAATLAQGLASSGWPTLGAVRGRVLFYLDCERDFCLAYAGPDLEGRVAFVASEPGDAFAAVRVMNTPGDDVRAAVAAGYLVRTRAVSMPEALHEDGPTLQADLDLALASGAQIISTDVPVPRGDVAIHAAIPDGTPSRCNPVTAPPECISTSIEDPTRIVPH